MPRPVDPQLKERVLTVAERFFHEQGYAGVSMQELADALGMRKASLYHYAPEGKEQLFVAVMERRLTAHGAKLRQALTGAGPNLDAQLLAVAGWAIAHAPLGLLAMQHTDLPALSAAHSAHLERTLDEQIWYPVKQLFTAAAARGVIYSGDADLRTGALLSMLDGLTASGARGRLSSSMEVAAGELIELLLRGMAPLL